MPLTLRRIVATAGAAALIAGAVIVAAPSAQADGGYYGTWTLTTLKVDNDKRKCAGTDSGSRICPGGETLTLKSNYRYKASSYIAQIMFNGVKGNGKGSFVAPVFPGTGDRALVLEGDATGIPPLGIVWQITLKGSRSGSPTKMILTQQAGLFEARLVFQRDAN